MTELDASDRKAIGAALSAARHARGINQRQLAEVTGIPQGKVSRIERGVAAAPITMLAEFARGVEYDLTVIIRPRVTP